MSKKNKIIIGVTLLLYLSIALFLVFTLHRQEQQMVKSMIAEEEKEIKIMEVIKSKNTSYADIYFKNIRDVDVKRGVYALETVVDMYGDKGTVFPEFNLNNGNINNKKVISKETIGNMDMERQRLVSGHIFSAISICYPLDTQILNYEIVPKSQKYSDVVLIRKVDVDQEKLIDGYKVIQSGTVGKMIKENANDEQLGLRAFIILKNSSFISFVKFNLMLIIAFTLAVVSISANPSPRFGMALATILITSSSIGVNFNKVPELNNLTYLEVAAIYYVTIFLAFFITTLLYVRVDKKEGIASMLMYKYEDKVKEVELVIAQHGSNEELEKIKEEYQKEKSAWKGRQNKQEKKLLEIDKLCYAIVIMFGGFFIGSYLILSS